MASLVRAENLTLHPLTPTISHKPISISTAIPKSVKAVPAGPPRIDYEPIYASLKAAVGSHWGDYKDALAQFLLGSINQEELSERIDHFISPDINTAHLHNQLLSAIHGNIGREPAEPGVASWVSANDKPSAVAKTIASDVADQRLKREIMQLPTRDRQRIKGVQDEPFDEFKDMMNNYRNARTVKLPDYTPTSAGAFSKTNIELEIRKRYAQPLASETHELPDTTAIKPRLEPICYQEGLPSGFDEKTPEFLEIALQTWIKEALASIANKVRSNGPNYIKTAKYKRRLEREEEMFLRGEITRDPAERLPVEKESADKQRPLDLADLKLAFSLGDPYLAHLPLGFQRLHIGRYERLAPANGRDEHEQPKVNGVVPEAMVNGVNGHLPDTTDPNEDFGWQGGSSTDRDFLGSVLDDIMDVDQ